MKIFFQISLWLLVFLAAAACFTFYRLATVGGSGDKDQVLFTVEPGEGVNVISAHLAERKLIKSRLAFETYVWLKRSEDKLMAGDHRLNAGMSIKEVFETLKSGDSVDRERTITIIEGWRADEIAAYLTDRGFGAKNDFLKNLSLSKWRNRYDFLDGVKTETVEGFLFPDTYRLFTDADSLVIIEKMLDNFGRKFSVDLRLTATQRRQTIFETVVLASIVEREAMTETDQKMVAGVFLNRLAAGMPLQSDATVNYITQKGMRRPLLADLEIDSPYNTYKYRGLPPGPISNPGLTAIKAVIDPIESDYLYFLMDENGQAHYAKTYAEHLDNIRKYLN